MGSDEAFDPRWAELKAKLYAQLVDHCFELGFPLDSIVEFTDKEKEQEPWFRDKQFVVRGAIRMEPPRIELDTWPRTNVYCTADIDQIRWVKNG